MTYRLQRVDLHRFLAVELPLHELAPDLRQQIRHALHTKAPLEHLAARAIRELLASGILRPVGRLRRGEERIPLHALPGSGRAYDLRSLLDAEPVLSEPPASEPLKQDAGQSVTTPGKTANGNAWASISAMRTLLKRDWVAHGLEASLGGVVEEIRRRFGGSGLRLVLWPDRLGISLQEGDDWELVAGEDSQRSSLLEALSQSGERAHLAEGLQWFPVWAQQHVVGALGVGVELPPAVASEAAGVVGDLLHAFLRSQARVFTDALTGIHNRSFFEHQFPVELERSRRANQPLALLFADIDHFKSVNDRFGHEVGDLVLQNVARLIVTHMRRIDYAFRWGGEEFAMLLPGTRSEEAYNTAERLRQVVKETRVMLDENEGIQITMSVGMATFPSNSTRDAELLRCADQALYQAKEQGRDRVVVWSGAAPPSLGSQ